jgi:hypothetical protein
MRASAENDLIQDGYPAHVVGSWIGHTPKVQLQHYLRTLDSYFDKARNPKKTPSKKLDTSLGPKRRQNASKLVKNDVQFARFNPLFLTVSLGELQGQTEF